MPDGGWRHDADGLPQVHGAARLASMLLGGESFGALLDMLGAEPSCTVARAGWLMDRSWLYALNFSPYQAARLQQQALALAQIFHVRGTPHPLRLLALCAPGDLMVNAPLDFIAPAAGAQLDLAFLRHDSLPARLPAHDVAIVAASESAPEALRALIPLHAGWNGPILNDPARILPMSREWLSDRLRGLPGVVIAPAWRVTRQQLVGPLPAEFPLLLRPAGSHAGQGLVKADDAAAVTRFLADVPGDAFQVTRFIDYRGGGEWYCKYRIAFVAGAPFICHMAASEHWMVHYLNAGMAGCERKRAAEQHAMENFDTEFAARHRAALAAVADTLGLDYFSIDCAETPDGRLLVFEADVAAIIHSMDPPDTYPYKAAAMQRCYDAFGAMLRQRASHVRG